MDYLTRYDGRVTPEMISLREKLFDTLGHAFLWCSEATRSKLVDFVYKSTPSIGVSVAALASASESQKKEREEFVGAFNSVYKSIAEELGVKILQSQLDDIGKGFGQDRQK
jgi:hypothetical protein